MPWHHPPPPCLQAPAAEATPTAEVLAPHVIGSKVWIRWPYLTEGLVSGIGDERGRVSRVPGWEGRGPERAQAASQPFRGA